MILFDDYYRSFWPVPDAIDFGYLVNRAITDGEIDVNRITDITISLYNGKSVNSLVKTDGHQVGSYVRATTTKVHIVISGDE